MTAPASARRRAALRWWQRPASTPWPCPALCPVCGGWSGASLCTACIARFQPACHRCQRCARRLAPGLAVCGECLQRPPPFERAVAALDYDFPWDRLIAEFKFRQRVELGRALSQRLLASLRTDEPGGARAIDLITAVPLSASRLRERGYNHSWEIARRLGRNLGLTARHDLLLRWRDTPHQIALDREQRAANLRGAFMPEPGARQRLGGLRIALVDDVMTTGATAAEATRALLEAGASSVHVWLLARTEPPA